MTAIGGYGAADENIRILMMASVKSQFGDTAVHTKLGLTYIGQHFVVITKKRFMGGYQVYMVTANMRNRPFISEPFKVTNAVTYEEARDVIERLCTALSSPRMFPLNDQPEGCCIPTGKDMIQLDEIPVEAHVDQDKYLEIGDELYCEVNVSGVKFFHSGIYAGKGEVYHFVCAPQESDSLAEVLAVLNGVPGTVLLDSWMEYVYALVEYSDVPPRIFRASHPLVCKSGKEIIRTAEHLQCELFTYDIRRRNCQHFSSQCSSGVPFSYDMTSGLKYIACTMLKPTSTLVSSMARTGKSRSSFNSSSTS